MARLFVSCDIAVHQKDGMRVYAVTARDVANGVVLGRLVLPGGPGGKPPHIAVADVVGMLGAYRCHSLELDLACRQVAQKTRRIKRALRRIHRQGSLQTA